eukprot:7537370-Prorocentrum_lima.AAC.1
MRTSVPGVYACGDLTGFSLLAHTAVREAEVAVHAVLGKEDCMSYKAVPGVVYTCLLYTSPSPRDSTSS